MQPAEHGFELDEFDPFFNYRATQFMVENGLPAYLEWNDDLSWHPYGRDVSATSQVMLHTTGAVFYQVFGAGSNLYDFTVWFPVVIGSLTTIVIFALVRTIGGTTAGLLASLFFAISPIIIMRGGIGWFKSEPLGLFYGLLAVYLLLSVIKSGKGKTSLAKIVGGGILLAFGVASWGGIQFFILPIGVFFLALPFMRKDSKFIIWTSAIFVSVFFLVTVSFERTGIAFISSLTGFFLVGCSAFLIVCTIVRKISNKAKLRNGLALLGGTIISGIALVASGDWLIQIPLFRYLNAANPYLTTTDMLVDSVSEHASTTTDISFWFFSILLVFAGIGAWLLFQKKVIHSLNIKPEMVAFALILGFLGIYFSSAFVRLEVLGSISIITLASIGVSILISKILKTQHKPVGNVTKISFLTVIVILLIVPLVYPENGNWSDNASNKPISILHSGSHLNISTNDWPNSMQWLKENTPEGAVIASWWDYGYWISTLSERKTLADNSTLVDWQIRKIAAMYLSTPHDAWHILTNDRLTDVGSHYVSLPTHLVYPTRHSENVYDSTQLMVDHFERWKNNSTAQANINYEKTSNYSTIFDYWQAEEYVVPPILGGLDADYILVNVVADKLSEENLLDLYTMRQKGGDETKAYWFMKISDVPVRDYFNPGIQSYTNTFWNDTLLGNLIPFTPLVYVDPDNPEIQSDTFKPGYIPIYVKDIKFPADGNGPFQLVYMSPSFDKDVSGPLTGPIIYKVNKEYNPNW